MDSGRLPAYRSSYLLRFHPYPRVKPSARERIAASTRDDEHYEPLQLNILHPESNAPVILNKAIQETGADDQIQLRQQRLLSMSSLVIELALLFKKNMCLRDD